MLTTNAINNKNKNSYIEWLLPFITLLSAYKFFGTSFITLALIGLVIVAFLTLLQNGWIIQFDYYKRMYLWFMIFLVLRDVMRIFVGYGQVTTQINRITGYVVFFLLVFVVTNVNFSEDKLFRAWKVCTVIAGLGIIYHVYILIMGGTVVPISIIPGYDIREDYMLQGFNRPLSFFSEPGAISTTLMPMLFLSLRRKELKWALLTSLFIFSTTSTTGIVLSAVLWLYFLITRRKINLKKRFWAFVLVVFLVSIYINTEIFAGSYTKLLDVLSGGSTFNSRIMNGFDIIGTMNMREMVFGTNYASTIDYVTAHYASLSHFNYLMIYYRNSALFLNAITNIILNYGIVTLCFYFWTFYKMYSIKGYEAKAFVAVSVISAFGQSVFLNTGYFVVIILLLLYAHKSDTAVI